MRRRRLPPSGLPARTSPRIVCRPSGSAVRNSVQPAADFRHVQRHRHELDVLCAPPARSLRRRRLPPSRLPARTSPCIVCPLLSARQYARVFNQPLSFNTSSVTTVSSMFEVRSARVACPQSVYSSPPLRVACAVVTHRFPSPSSHLLAPARPPLSAWQYAWAFNQPLSFGTFSVTDMSYMLYVRSVHALRTTQPPARTSPRIVCPPYGSAVRKSVQPAAEF